MKDTNSINGKDIRYVHNQIETFPNLPLNISSVFFTIVNSVKRRVHTHEYHLKERFTWENCMYLITR